MRKLILFMLLVLGVSITSKADDYRPLKKQSVVFTDSTTKDNYIINDIKYPIFKTKTGAFYIWKTSKKTNKKYRYYLPKEIQIQMGRVYPKTN